MAILSIIALLVEILNEAKANCCQSACVAKQHTDYLETHIHRQAEGYTHIHIPIWSFLKWCLSNQNTGAELIVAQYKYIHIIFPQDRK